MEFESEDAGRRPQVSRQNLGITSGRIDERADDRCRRDRLVQQLHSLRFQLRAQSGHAGEVAARSIQTGDKPDLHWITAGGENDRDRCGRGLCRDCPEHITGGGNHGNLSTDQVGRQCWQPVVLLLRPTIFDRNVAAFDIAGFGKALAKRAQAASVPVRQCAAEEPDHRHGRLLGARGERPSCCCPRAANHFDEIAPSHATILRLMRQQPRKLRIAVMTDQPLHLVQEPVEIDRLGIEVITTRSQRPLAVAGHGMRTERDHRYRCRFRIGF
jgi:hypothetical protein